MYNLSASKTFVYFFDYGVCLFNLFIQFTCVALQFINPSSALATLLPMSFKVVSILSSLLSWVIILSSLPSATSSAMCRARKTSSSSLSFERFPSGELDSAGTSTLYTSFRLTDRKMLAKGENLIYAIQRKMATWAELQQTCLRRSLPSPSVVPSFFCFLRLVFESVELSLHTWHRSVCIRQSKVRTSSINLILFHFLYSCMLVLSTLEARSLKRPLVHIRRTGQCIDYVI